VVVRNGVVVHAPGQVDLGRSTRLANRSQRRVLRALYPTCAIPGCEARFEQCTIHHVRWWRHGGHTNLDNLVPLCSRHHHRVHDSGWDLTLDANRVLTIVRPDGTLMSTGPPTRGGP
jgi:5-methylcytosine-specific restriction endonuclease McrA